MTTLRCTICEKVAPDLLAKLDATPGTRAQVAAKFSHPDITDHSLKLHRRHRANEERAAEVLRDVGIKVPERLMDPEELKRGTLELGDQGGTLTTGTLTAPVSDWDEVLRIWNLDPQKFMVVQPVTFKAWDGFAKVSNIESYDEHGNPEVITEETVSKRLYSYKAQIVERVEDPFTDADLAAVRERIASRGARRTPGTGLGPESTLLVNWADWQLFKPEGGGVDAAVERVQRSLEATSKRLTDLRRMGRNVTGIAVANNGDPIEGCDSNYANQLFTVGGQGGTLRRQLILAGDLWVEGITELAPQADRFDFISTLCNHGELGRRGYGTKSVTDDSDNVGGLLAEFAQRVFKDRPGFDHLNWHIPEDEMTLLVELSGVLTAFNHGHKVAGSGSNPQAKFESWAKNQVFYNRAYQAVRLWVTAHYHHLALADMGDSWWVQCPSQDGGSKWLHDLKGAHSASGCLTMLVGEHDKRGWSDLEVV